jgi:hypothetical protein
MAFSRVAYCTILPQRMLIWGVYFKSQGLIRMDIFASTAGNKTMICRIIIHLPCLIRCQLGSQMEYLENNATIPVSLIGDVASDHRSVRLFWASCR